MHLIRPMIATVGLTGLLAATEACRVTSPDGAPDSARGSVQAVNLLPNASFELPLGEEPRQPGNWGDILNPLTINLAASHQQPGNWPPRRVSARAVEGDHAAQVTLDPAGDAFVGHLTSPVVPVRGGQVYTLSACAERGSGRLGEAVPVDPTAGLETARSGGFRRPISVHVGARRPK